MPNWVVNQVVFEGEQKSIDRVLDIIKGEDDAFDFNTLVPMPKELNLPAGCHDSASMQYALRMKSATESMDIIDKLKKIKVGFYRDYANKIMGFNRFTMEQLEDRKKDFEEELNNHTNQFDTTDYDGLGIKSFEDLGNAYINNILTYGADTWYEWCIENWGTKWNACESDLQGNVMYFDTAWSCPIPVLTRLGHLCSIHGITFTGMWADEDTGHNVGVFNGGLSKHGDVFSYEEVEDASSKAYKIYEELWGESDCIGKDDDGNYFHYDCDENCPHKCY